MNIDAITAIRQAVQTPRPDNIQQHSAQVDAFRDLVRNGAVNDTQYGGYGLDNPATLTERAFSRISQMQQRHHEVMVPIQERMLEYIGDGRQVDETAPPYDSHHNEVAQMLPTPDELDSMQSDYSNLSPSEHLEKIMETHNEKMRETLRMQFDVGRAVVEEELLAGIAGRSARNLDMLLRGQ